MPHKENGLSQTTLLLRLLCGGYLIYLGISLLAEGAEGVLFAAAAAVFILVGAALLVFTLRAGLRKKDAPEDSDGENEREESS